MICVKLHKKTKKNLKIWTLWVFKGFFKTQNLGFSKQFSSPGQWQVPLHKYFNFFPTTNVIRYRTDVDNIDRKIHVYSHTEIMP